MKRLLATWGTIIVTLTTVVCLFLVRSDLPTVGSIILICIVVAFVASLVFGLLWVLLHLRGTYLNQQTIILEHQQVLALRRGLNDVQVHYAPPIPQPRAGYIEQSPLLSAPSPYPQAPAFNAIRSLIKPGRLILGFNVEGPIYGDITDLLSMAFVGKPGTGKSSALLYYLAMLLMVGASVHVLDPHGSLNELSEVLNYSDDLEEIAEIVPSLFAEIHERERLWKQSKTVKGPMLVLIDELPVIARWEQKNKPEYSLLDLIEKIVLEARKFNVFTILTGQGLPADVLPTLTRDNLSSRLVFNVSGIHARMAGLDEESRKKLLPLLRRAQPGTAILDVSRRPQPDIAALPYTTIDDLRNVVESVPVPDVFLPRSCSVPPLTEPFPVFPDVPENAAETDESIPTEEREQIISLFNEGVPRREMCAKLGKGEAYYPIIKRVLDEYEQQGA